MNQTLRKITSLFETKETGQQSAADISKRFRLQLVSSQPSIPSKKIAERAFMIWQERGCSHGNDFEDWIFARIQLEDELN